MHGLQPTRILSPTDRDPPSSTFPPEQVLRHTALVTGLFYGLFHARTVQAAYDERVLAAHEHHKDDLLHQAKEAFKAAKDKKNSPTTKGAFRRFPLPPPFFELSSSPPLIPRFWSWPGVDVRRGCSAPALPS